MRKIYKLLLQSEDDFDDNTAGQKKIEMDIEQLKEQEYSADSTEEEIVKDQLHGLLDGLIEEYLFADDKSEEQ